MYMLERYCGKYDITFGLIGEDLYTLEDNEWVPVDWDIVAEDDEMNEDYSWVLSKLLSYVTEG